MKTAADLDERLLAFVRRRFQAPGAEYASPPRILGVGVDARVYAFSLRGSGAAPHGPLVLRLFHSDVTPGEAHIEASFQGALASLGYPSPEVHAIGNASDGLGSPFVLMAKAPGVSLMACIPWFAAACVAADVFLQSGIGVVGLGIYLCVDLYPQLRLHEISHEDVAKALAIRGVERRDAATEGWLDRIEARIDRLGLDALRPGLDWLRANPPSETAHVTCHGDYWPGNVLVGRRGIRVLDWAAAALAPREYDLSWSLVQADLPLPWLRGWPRWADDLAGFLVRPVVRLVGATHRLAYRSFRKLDRTRLRYFVAFHCLRSLTLIAGRTGQPAGGDGPPSFDLPTARRAARRLSRRFERATGVSLAGALEVQA